MLFATTSKLSEVAITRQGLKTGNNEKFLRLWHEVSLDHICSRCRSRGESAQCRKNLVSMCKGRPFRKWYGNMFHVVNWYGDGQRYEITQTKAEAFCLGLRTWITSSRKGSRSNSHHWKILDAMVPSRRRIRIQGINVLQL